MLVSAQQSDWAPAAVGLLHLLTGPVAPVTALLSSQEDDEVVVVQEQQIEVG
jgi:hypothetical protein